MNGVFSTLRFKVQIRSRGEKLPRTWMMERLQCYKGTSRETRLLASLSAGLESLSVAL